MDSISSSVPILYKYDVFLSFRGVDTRYSFTAHLYEALRQAGIATFRDDDEIREGQELKPEIERSIEESRASIIVFSENFANSRWCLDELWLILRQKSKGCHLVFPVFYKVDPSDVRNQRGSFTIKAKAGAEGSKWTQDNMIRWKAALTEVAELKGMVVSGYETTFIRNVVEKVYFELGLKLRSNPTALTGIETRAEVINSWLRYEQPASPVLAISGMGGSGKTTLAKHIYYSNKQNFEGCSFLEEIGNQPDGLLGVQKKLLTDISGNNSLIISNTFEGTLQIEKAIHMNRVLIVVDDIDDEDKLSLLFGTKKFHTQSKIIITTRLLNIDTWFESIAWRCHVHKMELLNCHESLDLLSCHAFGSRVPMEGFEELAVNLAQYCGGNPLALKVLGSSLSYTAQDRWTRNDIIDVWRSRINSLNSLEGDLDHKIQDVLEKSFKSLPCDSHKEMFLHIACLFVGEYASHVERILENDYHAKSGMLILINRCLLTLSRNGLRLTMHKLLQDMARKIVRNESKDPAKQSRVWRYDESYRLLRKGDGSERIEGLALNMLKFNKGRRQEAFRTSSLVKMKNLKFLHLSGVKLIGPYENFPDLRWLRWHGFNLNIIPRGLLMSTLVAIDMSYGKLIKFEMPMVLNSLKILDLSCSYKLVSICDLHRLPKLVDLVLFDCTSWTHVCKTMEALQNLSFLNFARCPKLLESLFVCGGTPDQPLFSLPKSLSGWSLASNPFETLPNSIDLKMLQYLNLNGCPNLKSLPCLPSTLKELNIDWCTSLERITFQSARFTLEKFDYEGCFKLCEIEGLFKLVSVAKLDESDIRHMRWIEAYQDHKVDLVGDVITEGRTFDIQMLFEYGIRSTYQQGIKDQSMMIHEYTSSSRFLSFHVPFHPKKNRILGLNVMFLYRSPDEEDRDMLPPLAKISNITKRITWVYNPVVFCEPRVDEDVVWLSYWPIGDLLDVGDEVHVVIFLDKKVLIVRECGASLVYMDDCNLEEENCETMKWEEVIGGDLSEFEVTKGGYYLCRIDFFQSRTADVLKKLFGDNSLYRDSRRWRPSSQPVSAVYPEVKAFRNPKRYKIEVEVGVNFNSESETDKIGKAVSSLVGVESVSIHKEIQRLFVVGRIDPQVVAMCVSEFQYMVQVLAYTYYGNG